MTYQRVTPPYEKRGDWIGVQLWAKENTPIDAMFITPPYLQGFRIYSERGAVAEWKDDSSILILNILMNGGKGSMILGKRIRRIMII
jgi:hypothetical protein